MDTVIDGEPASCNILPDGTALVVIKGREHHVNRQFNMIWLLRGTAAFWSCAAGGKQEANGRLVDRDYVIVNGTVYGPLVGLLEFKHDANEVRFKAIWCGESNYKWTTVTV